MGRTKSLKGNRQAQRNYMAKELQKKQYQGRSIPVKKKYNKKKERRNEIPEDFLGCEQPTNCEYPDCICNI